ncbi:MAG TPA: hypothetical protein VGR81_07570 [Candidatus Acidoferrales bacterium]|nr:hypothetical protein [Candidatus Acidoferrales bacterium]
MTQILFSIAIGLLLLALLFVWVFRERASESGTALEQTDGTRPSGQELPPPDLIERILDPGDLEFVSKESAAETVKLLERERRALAVAWLHQTRRQVGQVMSRHVVAVRHSRNLRPGLEIRLALHYASFVMGYKLTLVLFYVRGPFQVRPAVNYVTGIVARFYGVSDRLLDAQLAAERGAPLDGAVS